MVKLTELLEKAGNPKVFFVKNEKTGKEAIFVNSVWLDANFAGTMILSETVSRYWGIRNPTNIFCDVDNDTNDTYGGYSISKQEQKDEILKIFNEYKLRQSLKIEVLIS